jgi:predicted NBD/HSP70 family sugar kinase
MAKDTKRPLLPSVGALALLPQIAAARSGLSRGHLAEVTGLSRVTVGQRLSELFEAAIITEGAELMLSGGRPRHPIRLNNAAALIAAADVGETHLHIAITDLAPTVLVEETIPFDLNQSPATTLTQIALTVTRLIAGLNRRMQDLVGLGLSLPAPVNFREGTVVGPSVMAGWDDFDIRGFLGKLLPIPVIVDNDVNLLAMAEVDLHANKAVQIVYVKIGTGIGCGIMADERLFRGANGASGDIGHIQLITEGAKLCRCGKLGCVEAHAAGWAIARDLREMGYRTQTARDVVDLVRGNVPEAIQLVRQAGRVVGEVVADLVSILNPDKIIVGGMMAETSDHLLSGVREMVYQRCLPLATRNLSLALSKHDPQSGVRGAALLIREWAFSAENTKSTVRRLFENLHPKTGRKEGQGDATDSQLSPSGA